MSAVDMAAAGANPKRAEEVSSFSDYCEPLMELMRSLVAEERVVLVGHSMGGVCISVALEKFPGKVCVAVFCHRLHACSSPFYVASYCSGMQTFCLLFNII